MANRHQATSTNVEDYWQLFVNRRAYVLQSKRPHPESGRYYYFRPKDGGNGEPVSLTAATIRRHLEGDVTLGVYAMNPAFTQRRQPDCRTAITRSRLNTPLRVAGTAATEGGSGIGTEPTWLPPVDSGAPFARQCRLDLRLGRAEKLGIPVKGAGTAEGIEVFPKHDEIEGCRRLRQCRPRASGNSPRNQCAVLVLRADYNLDNQPGVPQTCDEAFRAALERSDPEVGRTAERGRSRRN